MKDKSNAGRKKIKRLGGWEGWWAGRRNEQMRKAGRHKGKKRDEKIKFLNNFYPLA